jgi:hypothetical protein
VCHWYASVGGLFPSVGTGLFRPHWPSLKMAVADFALRNRVGPSADAQVFGCHHPNIATQRHATKIMIWMPICIQRA